MPFLVSREEVDEGQKSLPLRGSSRTSHNTVCDDRSRELSAMSLAHIMPTCLRSMPCLLLIAPDVLSQHFMRQVIHDTRIQHPYLIYTESEGNGV